MKVGRDFDGAIVCDMKNVPIVRDIRYLYGLGLDASDPGTRTGYVVTMNNFIILL